MKVSALLIALMVAYASARCANDCSGKGTCNAANQCVCFRNFHGPDCSHRLCTFGRAFVDSPIGDTNGDNEVSVQLAVMEGKYNQPTSEKYSADYAAARNAFQSTASWDEAHFYRECSNKGLCDESTGLCECFPGYEGSGCARKSCPKDCSGHGQCKNYEGTTYMAWDNEATMYCDCDAGYSGPGCENRLCPSGIDPVQAANLDTSRFQRIAFRGFSDKSTTTDTFAEYPFGDVYFTITLTDEYGDEWTTELMTVKYDLWEDTTSPTKWASFPRLVNNDEFIGENKRQHVSQTVDDALEGLPHNVAGKVEVHEIYTMHAGYGTGATESFADSDWTNLYCSTTDIYGNKIPTSGVTSVRGPAGCGLAIVDKNLNTASTANTVRNRDGNHDIVDQLACIVDSDGFVSNNPDNAASATCSSFSNRNFLVLTVPIDDNTGRKGTGAGLALVQDSLSYTNSLLGLSSAGTASVSGLPVVQADPSGTIAGFAYYQFPHFNNDDASGKRFPLFGDPEEAGTYDYSSPASDGANAWPWFKNNVQYNSYLLWDPTNYPNTVSDGKSAMAGLSLFVYFNKDVSLQTASDGESRDMRVDYFFNNKDADRFLGDGSIKGQTVEGKSTSASSSNSVVRVDDFTANRVWDVSYWGREQFFLGQKSFASATDTTTVRSGATENDADAGLHSCSKRGICDYTTGLCSCFSGYTGNNCGNQNALAY